ncbi:MAG: carboxypeptidase regulatory-like domain-containing protein [Candidatus Hydrogenedentes bacterium]|nr:carboxypeptidase regulatory-like domain-containing protein [Candidatus Hydrogenedentota bacterium]
MFCSAHTRLSRIAVAVAVLGPLVWAGTVHAADTALPKRVVVETRTGPYFEVDVALTTPGKDVDELSAAGYNVTNVNGNVATLYVTADELLWLYSDGYSMLRVEQQPTAPPEPETAQPKALGAYHGYTSLTTELQTYADNHTSICRIYTLGQSVQGRELWAMLITDNPDVDEEEPEFKYVSTMHGDEPIGTELCLYLIDYLLAQYGTVQRVTDLVDNTAIWIVPCMNPDGLVAGTRYNSNGADLNRSFPERTEIAGTLFDQSPLNETGRPIEVQHVMQWTADNSFVLSANLHSGALLFNYLYDDDGKGSGVDAPTPDDTLIEALSLRYASHNTPMYTNSSPSFTNGIVNGSLWYEASGSMQDWNYRYVGCIEGTVELSTTKKPSAALLPTFWSDNQESMLSYIEGIHRGVRGLVTSSVDDSPVYAKVTVAGNAQPVFTDADVGDYYRLLLPGTYDLKFAAVGFENKTVEDVTVVDGAATRQDVELTPIDADVNNDAVVDAADIQVVVLAILGQPNGGFDADVDKSGAVNTVDLQSVVVALLKQ